MMLYNLFILFVLFGYNKYFKLIKGEDFLLFLVISIAYFEGVLTSIGFTSFIINALDLSLLSILGAFTLSRGRIMAPGLGYILFFGFIVLASFLFNDSQWFQSFTLFRYTLNGYLLFLFVYNRKFPEFRIYQFNRYIFFLGLVQIAASVLKFLTIGLSEREMIGTINTSGGALNTIYPLFASIFLASFYIFYNKNWRFILLIFGFLFMGFVGMKRGIFFLFPIVGLFIYWKYANLTTIKVSLRDKFSVLFGIALISIFVFFNAARFTPLMNPEGSREGGTFSIATIRENAWNYSYNTHEDQYALGRMAGLEQSIRTIFMDSSIINALIGYGPDTFINVPDYFSQTKRFGIFGLGSITGISFYILSVGVLGVLALLSFYYNLYRRTKMLLFHCNDTYWKSIIFGLHIIIMVIFVDFILYSKTSVQIPAILYSYFYFLGIVLSPNNRNYL